jgi:hypothetical protein
MIRSDDPVPVDPPCGINPIYIGDICDAVKQLASNRHSLPYYSLFSIDGPVPTEGNRPLAMATGVVPKVEFAKGVMMTRASLK